MICAEAREALAADEPCEGLEAHLAACAPCRDAALRYRHVQARLRGEIVPVSRALLPQPARRRWIPLAAAAALLLSVGLLPSRKVPPPAPAPVPVARKTFPREIAGLDVLSSSTYACARPGTRARALSADRIELVEGTLFVRADAIRVSTPFGEVEGREAAFQVRSGRTGSMSLFLREAWAADPQDEVLVESGTVLLSGALIPPGHRLLPGGMPEPVAPEPLAAALAWRDGDAAWQSLAAGGPRAFPARFLWEARLRLSSGAYLEVVLPDGKSMTLGAMQGLSDGREHRLVLRWDALPSLRVDGREVKAFPWREARQGFAGLRGMGGSLEILDWRWRPLP